MDRIEAKTQTLLKKMPVDSGDPAFGGDRKIVLPGAAYPVQDWEPASNNHIKVELGYGAGTWYIFRPHWDGPWNNKPIEILLPVPYLSQRDNRIRPSQTCNTTSMAMIVEFFYPRRYNGGGQLEDHLTQKMVGRWGNDSIYYHARIAEMLGEYGVVSRFSTNTSFKDIKAHLDGGNPVIFSGKFTRSGHILVLRGYDETGFFVNDPWGEWFASGYRNKSGENLHYSFAMMSRLSYSGPDHGWAHLCSKKSNGVAVPQDKLDGVNVSFIKSWEGLRLNAYLCSAGRPTIGFGSTYYPDGNPVKLGDKLTGEPEAIALLENTLTNDFLPELRKIPHWGEMNANQRTAIASFAYNLGAHFYGAPGFSTITSVLKNKHWDKVPSALGLYVRAGGKVIDGLVNRRAAEGALWNSKITRVDGALQRL